MAKFWEFLEKNTIFNEHPVAINKVEGWILKLLLIYCSCNIRDARNIELLPNTPSSSPDTLFIYRYNKFYVSGKQAQNTRRWRKMLQEWRAGPRVWVREWGWRKWLERSVKICRWYALAYEKEYIHTFEYWFIVINISDIFFFRVLTAHYCA